MRKQNLFALFCLCLSAMLEAQEPKGVSPLTQNSKLKTQNSTRAVVIGISDYQDAGIPDLRFADRDAEAFAAWLSSPAGGALPGASVKTLLNEQATTGKIIAALDGLISASKAGDLAIIYFSGHGDVERVTKFQRGYWLSWDSPPTVYAAGAFSLVFLQDIITTLAEAGVQVVVVSDACRAGKLAGSEYGGAQATTAALSKQFANEIKILSCQPNEFSLEGEQWGGGRGAFSYHLLDALYGLADQDADDRITVKELGRYLEDHVAAETAPHRQNPLVLGDREARLAAVVPEALAQWRQQKTGDALAFKKIDPRGFEDLMLAGADSSIRALYAAFTAALERGNLMPTDLTAGKSANDYYELLIQEPALADLHGLMTRNFAAALMDEGQQFINLLLKSDPQVMDYMYSKGRIDFSSIHLKLKRATELLGPKHYVYNTLKAKEYYFKAGTYPVEYYSGIMKDSVARLQKQTWLKGLSYDEQAPYLICRLLAFYELDSFKIMINHLEELAPKWAMAFDDMAFGYLQRGETDLSIEYYKKAIAADSSYFPAYTWLASVLDLKGERVEAQKWRELHVQKAKEAMASRAFHGPEYADLGNSLWQLKRYKEAEKILLEGDRVAGGKTHAIMKFLAWMYCDMARFQDAIQVYDRLYKFNKNDYSFLRIGSIYHFYLNDTLRAKSAYLRAISEGSEEYYALYLGTLYYQNKQYENAGKFFENKAANDLELNFLFLFWLAETNRHLGNIQKANAVYHELLSLTKPAFRKHDFTEYLFHFLALNRLGKQKELEKAIQKASDSLENDPWLHFALACLFSMTNKAEKALEELGKAEALGWEPDLAIFIIGTVKDPMLDPLRHLPEFQAWEKRWSPPYKDYSKE